MQICPPQISEAVLRTGNFQTVRCNRHNTCNLGFPIHCVSFIRLLPGLRTTPLPLSPSAEPLYRKHQRLGRCAPLSMSLPMSDMPQIYLPDEVVHAILIRMEDSDKDDEPIKRGLASCSLTCRHWAKLIRPLLFNELTIRSAGDVAQLLVFLDGPDTLHPYLRDCIKLLRVIDDRTSSSIPWSHQISRLHRRMSQIQTIYLTIENSGADDKLHPGRESMRPFAIIPKTLPGSIMPIWHLTLSNLRLPSVKALASYVENLRTPVIKLNAVTFVKEDVPNIRRRRPHSHLYSRITVSNCFEDIAGLQRWFRITNVLHACQGRLWVGDANSTLAEKYMAILLSLSPYRDRAKRLAAGFNPSHPSGENSCYACPRPGLIASPSLGLSILSRRSRDIQAACECVCATR